MPPEPEPQSAPSDDESTSSTKPKKEVAQDFNDPDSEPAEMTALRLELSTLSTSHTSLQTTLVLLQTQLVDLKRVNQELQEENESYMILLRERTLSGQYDVNKQVNGSDNDSDDAASIDASSMRSRARSTLEVVEEEPFEGLDSDLLADGSDSEAPQRGGRQHGKPERKRSDSSHGGRGESLAGLPITGPGLDLAAELGRAENKDILEGNPIDDSDKQPNGKAKKPKKENKLRHSESVAGMDIEALRTEVKSLKDANKALSLYASKIIDRIISQEGFEHVLAVDYDNEPSTPSAPTPIAKSQSLPAPPPAKPRERPQSVSFPHSTNVLQAKAPAPSPISRPSAKAHRRSLSFDWKSFSLFSGDKKTEPPANLRPLTLKPGSMPLTGTPRKLDNQEDEEDRKERERLHATMKLMGIQPTPPPPMSPNPSQIERSVSSPAPSTAKPNRRFSLFGSRTPAADTDNSSTYSAPSLHRGNSLPVADLTEEALNRAEAEQSLAVLDAKERELTVEISKGSNGGFTEIARRSSRRSRKSGGSSGSTVFSAGLSASGDGHE